MNVIQEICQAELPRLKQAYSRTSSQKEKKKIEKEVNSLYIDSVSSIKRNIKKNYLTNEDVITVKNVKILFDFYAQTFSISTKKLNVIIKSLEDCQLDGTKFLLKFTLREKIKIFFKSVIVESTRKFAAKIKR